MWKTPIWTPEGEFHKYAIDEYGNVIALNYNRTGTIKFLRQDIGRFGYMRVTLATDEGKTYKRFLIHRLVMWNFNNIQHSEDYDVNHISGEKADNRLCNLEWVTKSENMVHAVNHHLVDYSNNGKHLRKVSDTIFQNILTDIFIHKEKTRAIADKYNVSLKYIRDVKACRHRKRELLKFVEKNHITLTERQVQRLSKWCCETQL